MKKLLSLLSVLTISGTAVPKVIAASPYQKQEKIKNKRQKRSNNENNKINLTKIVIKTNGIIYSSGLVFNDKIYFGSEDYNVYEYDPNTGQQKVIVTARGYIKSSGVVLNNKLYFGSGDGYVYEYDPNTGQQKVVIRTGGQIWSSGVDLNNKLYFGSDDNNVYEYDPNTGQQKVVIRTKGWVRISGVVLNNKLYIGSFDGYVYEYDFSTRQQKTVMTTNTWTASSGVILNNKLYIGSSDYNVYEYGEYYINLNLEQINDNSNIAILNEFNYLNPNLDISQLEIIKKTNTSASIKIKNKFNSDISIVNIKYSINNELNKILNLNELIKKAIFFKFCDENPNLIFKEINSIDTNNLNFSNVEVTKKENSFLSYIDIKSICNNKEFFNKTSNIKSFNIPACVYNSKYKLTFQLLTGLTKINQENKLNGWNINSEDEMKLTDFVNTNYNKNNEIINELSNDFDLSNTNKQEHELIIYYLNEASNKFEINPNEKLQVNYSPLRINKYKNMLNLKQEITGTINTKIISSSNEEKIITISIKEAMQILKNYNLLPNEIIINNNSVTFNGKASISSEIEGKIKQSILISIA